jgi:hypothetical protein
MTRIPFDSRDRKLAQGRRGTTSTLAILVVSIVTGTALAITCSYRPIVLWWVMVACSAINLVRFGASRKNAAVSLFPKGHASHALVAFVKRRFAANLARGGRRTGAATTSKSSLDRQNSRFLIWFTQHNLLCTTVGFGGSLLLWHRFGPTTPALIVMSALMSCGVFAAIGATVGARLNGLGLCWREPCRTPDFRSIPGLVQDVGTVLVLRNRHEHAAARDWAKGGRFHELFLAIDELARAGVEPGLAATLHDDGEVAWRKLANKERYDRALALAPVFVASLLCAALVVPRLAGTEPLPSLWDIVTANAAARSSSVERDDDGTPTGTSPTSEQKNAKPRPEDARPPSGDASAKPAPRAPATTDDAPDRSAPQVRVSSGAEDGGTGGKGDRSAGARTDDLVNGQAREGAGNAEGAAVGADGGGSAGNASGQTAGSANASGSSKDDQSDGSGGRGGGPHGHGNDGVAPQRASSPAALSDAPPNPGKVIEVVLPPFAQAKGESTGDDATGQKREGTPPTGKPAYQPMRDATTPSNEPTSREPVQRWPNWVFRLLHK